MTTLGTKCAGRIVRPGYLEVDVTVEFDEAIEWTGTFTTLDNTPPCECKAGKHMLIADGPYVLMVDHEQRCLSVMVEDVTHDLMEGTRGRFSPC